MSETLKELTLLDGPSGYEDKVREFILNHIPKDFSIQLDRIGNLIVSNNKNKKPVILFASHMDEVGFMVQHITNEGFIKFVEIGGWDERILPSMKVKLLGKKEIVGIIGSIPPHILDEKERKKVYKIQDLWIDTGYNKEELSKFGIDVGTYIVPYSDFTKTDDIIIAKALDDRVGCFCLLNLIEIAKEVRNEVILSFTVQEEVGLRGARIVSNQLNPDLAVIVECTAAGDVPGIEESRQSTVLNGGTAITVMDKRFIANKKYIDFVFDIAERRKIKLQIKKPLFGATDAGEIHLAKKGVPSIVISCPARYIHSPYSITKLANIYNTLEIAKEIILQSEEINIY